MKIDYLVPALVADENDEGSVVLLDIVVDENRNSGIQLFSHWPPLTSNVQGKKQNF